MRSSKCQMQDKDTIHVGRTEPVLLSFRTRLTLMISNCLDVRIKRFIKNRLKLFNTSRTRRNYPDKTLNRIEMNTGEESLKAGDMVRVRSINEIRETLNEDNWLRGCKFMPEMEQYCGTIQRIYKPVNRFLNECDYTIRKAKGLILLENVFCQGVAGAGPCDRSCFYFWRVEWLERV